MLNLSRDDRQQLRASLTSGFRSYPSLKIFVSDNFDFRLNDIATSTATRTAADDLIEYCEECGTESDLILALHRERPGNGDVQKLMSRLQGFVQQRLLLDPSLAASATRPFELPEPYDDKQLEFFLPRPLSYEADVGTLQRGLQLASAVCKVSFTDRSATGTGVLIAPDLVLTNYHVLSEQIVEPLQLAERTKTLLCEFGFVSEEGDRPIAPDPFAVEVAEPIVACSPTPELDYILLRLEPKIKNSDFQPLSVGVATRPPSLEKGQGLNVLQHPEGEMMQVSLSASGVVGVDAGRGRVWYVNRTQGGSSGSPCFTGDWEMVALHHASISRGFGSIREGILLSSIEADIFRVSSVRIG